MKPHVVAVVPGRMASSRFPGKPLAKICGIPMIGHCYFRTAMAKTLAETWIATCDREIYDYARSVGAKAVMTKDTHERACDRAAEAMLNIERETGRRVDVLCMVQGDEPLLRPEMVDEAVTRLLQTGSKIACLMADIETQAEFDDPNCVKVVTDLEGRALYFSREPIPSRKKWSKTAPHRKQVPVIPFQRDYLLRFTQLAPTPLEQIESVDLMRCLEHGDAVPLAVTTHKTVSVDTPADLKRAEAVMAGDPLLPRYSGEAALK